MAVSIIEWFTLIILLLLLLLLIAAAEKLRSIFGWPLEVTRKFVHVVTGVLIFFTPYLFNSAVPLMVLALLFIILNFMAIRFHFFKGMHGTQRITYGTVYYPLAFLLLLWFFWNRFVIIIQLSMLVLAISDAMAAIVGEHWKNPHSYSFTSETKSLEGSLTMMGVTFLIIFVGVNLLHPDFPGNANFGESIWIAVVTAMIATAAEALSFSGSDNLSAPLGAAFVLHFMLTHGVGQNLQFTIGALLALGIAILSFRFRFLDGSGAGITFLLGTIIFGVGGWIWGVPILIFFFSSSVLSKMWGGHKQSSNLLYEKSSQRDLGQVLANGGVPAVAVLLFYGSNNPAWYFPYLGALAAVTADTWATEIGALSPTAPRLVTTFRKVVAGTSGAVSLVGTLGAFLGAFFIAAVGYGFRPAFSRFTTPTWVMITLSGLVASFIDSLIGATLQAQYRCPACHQLTEKRKHCNDSPTIFERGIAWIQNDLVNFFCGAGGFLLVLLGRTLLVR